jgi:hypothetical protein
MKLVVALAAGALAVLPVAGPAWASAAEEAGTLPIGLAPAAALHVQDISGDVTIRSGPAFSVRFRKYGGSDPSGVRVLGEQRDGETRVCVRYPGDDGRGCDGDYSSHVHSDVSVDLIVTVPPRTRVNANDVNGTVDVRTSGLVNAQTVNGRVIVDAAAAESLRTVNGEISATLHDPRAFATLRAETINGAVTIRMPSGSAHVRASALNGDIAALGLPVTRPQFGPGASVDGQSGSGGPSLILKTLNGSIRVEPI